MPQYFDNVEELGHKDITIHAEVNGRAYSYKSDLGLFSKDSLDDGTRLLLETIAQVDLGKEILDLGCGAGPIGLILASTDPNRHVCLSDVNRRALELVKQNAVSMGVSKQIETVDSDVYTNIDSTYDTIVSNPPIRAGKRVTYRIYDEAPSYLKDKGRLIIVIRKKQGAESVLAHLKEIFKEAKVIESHKGYQVIVASK
ncbi:MAG: methyltransferase [Bacilli bacterium]|jgi:16S rRNA (guanine1207-N2)-methyltransferase|nr:methyltransferase [Bacilli bacterium]MCH4210522.1 methyltransferase [Bacilli bacterium]MCH4228091.1 methyltransferase [Bacilli bacterium]MCH4278182.1 methyltransferase [Bacilli bacterium]MCI2054603.1 methyltransferase [Bacilli bacterium]